MLIRSISDYRATIRNGKYAWPGGYPVYLICSDGAVLCFDCAKAERRNILEAVRDQDRSGWNVVATDINWEDGELTCEHCSKRIESAYAD